MKKTCTIFALATALVAAMAPAAFAAPSPSADTNSYDPKSVYLGNENVDGKEIHAGDVLTFKITFQNPTGKHLDEAIVYDYVPSGTEYVEGSATYSPTIEGNKLVWTFNDIDAGAYAPEASFQVKVSTKEVIDKVENTAGFIYDGKEEQTNTVASSVNPEQRSAAETAASTAASSSSSKKSSGTTSSTSSPKTEAGVDFATPAAVAFVALMGAAGALIALRRRTVQD